MSAAIKEKPPAGAAPSATRLFGEIGAILAQPAKTKSARQAQLRRSLSQLNQFSRTELDSFRDVVKELVVQVGHLTPSANDAPASAEERKRAAREDATLQAVLSAPPRRGSMATPESRRRGAEAMAAGALNAANTMQERIAKGELISSGELQRALGVQRQAVSLAVKKNRLFAMVGPSGENFYPAFYADANLDRRFLESVLQVLGTLPAASKFHFMTAKSTFLGETPLEALRKGRVDATLRAAAGFAER